MKHIKLFEQFEGHVSPEEIKGLFINRVEDDEDYSVLKLNTDKGTLCFAPGGGAIVSCEGDTNPNNVTIKDVIDADEYGLTLVFDNGNSLSVYDDTGGEGLEIWWENKDI